MESCQARNAGYWESKNITFSKNLEFFIGSKHCQLYSLKWQNRFIFSWANSARLPSLNNHSLSSVLLSCENGVPWNSAQSSFSSNYCISVFPWSYPRTSECSWSALWELWSSSHEMRDIHTQGSRLNIRPHTHFNLVWVHSGKECDDSLYSALLHGLVSRSQQFHPWLLLHHGSKY